MRIANQLALFLVASNLAAHDQHFRQVTIPTGPNPRWIVVADVNHDRNPDIAVANAGSDSTDSGSITVPLGSGRRGLHPAPGSPFPAGHLLNGIAIGDMNNDGNLHRVVANPCSAHRCIWETVARQQRGTQTIVVACAESQTIRIYQRGAAGKFTATILPIAGG